MTREPTVRTELQREGGHLRLVLDRPKANVLSTAMIRDLRDAVAAADIATGLKLVTIEGAGEHFSYGASVEEHRSDAIAGTLDQLHGLIRDLLACPAPTAAVVRGRCLGGGFELALACDFIFAGSSAALGLPEIGLGVFPPAAAALLPLRAGVSRTALAVLTGEALPIEYWTSTGIVATVASDPDLPGVVDRWFDAHLATRSAAALRYAAQAARLALVQHVETALPRLETLYLETLMRTRDAVEGIEAFLEKRPPIWVHA
jgi:cyclohexa-1,5-dienecarbonyl-CoA hydratase